MISEAEKARRRRINKKLIPIIAVLLFIIILGMKKVLDRPIDTTSPAPTPTPTQTQPQAQPKTPPTQQAPAQQPAETKKTELFGYAVEGAMIAGTKEQMERALAYVDSRDKEAFEKMRKRREIIPIAEGIRLKIIDRGTEITEVVEVDTQSPGFMYTNQIRFE